jgi:hypothetical protein
MKKDNEVYPTGTTASSDIHTETRLTVHKTVDTGRKSETTITNLKEFLDSIHGDFKGVYYRGDKLYEHELLPKLYLKEYDEKQLVHYAVTNYPDEFEGYDNFDILVKMQHYGWPTRLLDITTNPLVALYFACSNVGVESNLKSIVYVIFCPDSDYYYEKGDKNLIIHEEDSLYFDSDRKAMLSALSKFNYREHIAIRDSIDFAIKTEYGEISNISYFVSKLREHNANTPSNVKKYSVDFIEKTLNKYVNEIAKTQTAFYNGFHINPHDIFSCFVVRPRLTNDRIKAQDGCFLLVGLDKVQNERRKIFIKDEESRLKILKELDAIKINQQTLFPDLENGGKYFSSKCIVQEIIVLNNK